MAVGPRPMIAPAPAGSPRSARLGRRRRRRVDAAQLGGDRARPQRPGLPAGLSADRQLRTTPRISPRTSSSGCSARCTASSPARSRAGCTGSPPTCSSTGAAAGRRSASTAWPTARPSGCRAPGRPRRSSWPTPISTTMSPPLWPRCHRNSGPPSCSATSKASAMRRSPRFWTSRSAPYAAGSTAAALSCAPRSRIADRPASGARYLGVEVEQGGATGGSRPLSTGVHGAFVKARSCAELAELRSAFVDGALGDADRERLLAHLVDCADCRREVAELRHVRSLLTGSTASGPDAPWTSPPAGLDRRRRRPPSRCGRVRSGERSAAGEPAQPAAPRAHPDAGRRARLQRDRPRGAGGSATSPRRPTTPSRPRSHPPGGQPSSPAGLDVPARRSGQCRPAGQPGEHDLRGELTRPAVALPAKPLSEAKTTKLLVQAGQAGDELTYSATQFVSLSRDRRADHQRRPGSQPGGLRHEPAPPAPGITRPAPRPTSRPTRRPGWPTPI